MADRVAVISELNELLSLLADNGYHIQQAYLFGSVAKGENHTHSDIDFALVSEQFTGVRFHDIQQLLPYLRTFSSGLEIHPFRPEDFTDEDLFIQEIRNTGVPLC